MKTIQEYLGAADRQRLLDCLAYRFLSDPLRLLEAREYTVQEIMERYSGHMRNTWGMRFCRRPSARISSRRR